MSFSRQYKAIGRTTMLAPLPLLLLCVGMEACESEPAHNMCTVAWTGILSTAPPRLGISLKRTRYSYDLLAKGKRAVVHPVSRDFLELADSCGVLSGRDVDKYLKSRVQTCSIPEAEHVWAVQGCPLALPIEVEQILALDSHDLFICKILEVYVRDDLFDQQGRVALERADLMAYEHGHYRTLGDIVGFFGYSVADAEVKRRRLRQLKTMGKTVNRKKNNEKMIKK